MPSLFRQNFQQDCLYTSIIVPAVSFLIEEPSVGPKSCMTWKIVFRWNVAVDPIYSLFYSYRCFAHDYCMRDGVLKTISKDLPGFKRGEGAVCMNANVFRKSSFPVFPGNDQVDSAPKRSPGWRNLHRILPTLKCFCFLAWIGAWSGSFSTFFLPKLAAPTFTRSRNLLLPGVVGEEANRGRPGGRGLPQLAPAPHFPGEGPEGRPDSPREQCRRRRVPGRHGHQGAPPCHVIHAPLSVPSNAGPRHRR